MGGLKTPLFIKRNIMFNNQKDKTKKHKRNNRRMLRELKRNPELLEPDEITEENDNVIQLWEDEVEKAA